MWACLSKQYIYNTPLHLGHREHHGRKDREETLNLGNFGDRSGCEYDQHTLYKNYQRNNKAYNSFKVPWRFNVWSVLRTTYPEHLFQKMKSSAHHPFSTWKAMVNMVYQYSPKDSQEIIANMH